MLAIPPSLLSHHSCPHQNWAAESPSSPLAPSASSASSAFTAAFLAGVLRCFFFGLPSSSLTSAAFLPPRFLGVALVGVAGSVVSVPALLLLLLLLLCSLKVKKARTRCLTALSSGSHSCQFLLDHAPGVGGSLERVEASGELELWEVDFWWTGLEAGPGDLYRHQYGL